MSTKDKTTKFQSIAPNGRRLPILFRISIFLSFIAILTFLGAVPKVKYTVLRYWQRTTHTSAPLLSCDRSKPDWYYYHIPGEYDVGLWPYHTLEAHKAALSGIDMDAAIISVLKLGATIYYGAKFDNTSVDLVRAESSVKFVQCAGTFQPDAVRSE